MSVAEVTKCNLCLKISHMSLRHYCTINRPLHKTWGMGTLPVLLKMDVFLSYKNATLKRHSSAYNYGITGSLICNDHLSGVTYLGWLTYRLCLGWSKNRSLSNLRKIFNNEQCIVRGQIWIIIQAFISRKVGRLSLAQ